MSRRHRRRKEQSRRAAAIVAGLTAAALLLTITACAIIKGNTPKESPQEATGEPQTASQQTPHPSQQTPVCGESAVENSPDAAPQWEPDESEVDYLAKTIYGEAGVVRSKARQAAVAWCILNRVDSPIFPDTIAEVVTAPYQFAGYHADRTPPEAYYELARDVLTRYHAEQQGETDAGRTLPREYLYFTGDGTENYSTATWRGTDYWDWSLPDPYSD